MKKLIIAGMASLMVVSGLFSMTKERLDQTIISVPNGPGGMADKVKFSEVIGKPIVSVARIKMKTQEDAFTNAKLLREAKEKLKKMGWKEAGGDDLIVGKIVVIDDPYSGGFVYGVISDIIEEKYGPDWIAKKYVAQTSVPDRWGKHSGIQSGVPADFWVKE